VSLRIYVSVYYYGLAKSAQPWATEPGRRQGREYHQRHASYVMLKRIPALNLGHGLPTRAMVQVPAAYAGSSFRSPAPQVHTSGEGQLFLGANPPLLRQSSTKLLDSPVQVIDFLLMCTWVYPPSRGIFALIK